MLNREGYGALKGIWGQETQMDDTIPVCVVLRGTRRAVRLASVNLF